MTDWRHIISIKACQRDLFPHSGLFQNCLTQTAVKLDHCVSFSLLICFRQIFPMNAASGQRGGCSVIMNGNSLARVEMFWTCRQRSSCSRLPALCSSRMSVTIVHVFVSDSGHRASCPPVWGTLATPEMCVYPHQALEDRQRCLLSAYCGQGV